MKQRWRLLITPPAHGAWNMAVDEAILTGCGGPAALPTLRLFAWNPACLSLGYAQPAVDVDLRALELHGWQIVRRPTGGRAILHTDELTYSVIAPLHDPVVEGSVLQSYSRIAQALLGALERLSLAPQADRQYALPQGSRPNGPVCFEVPSNYEITVNGKKLIGSAQARRREGVLQHGTLPLCGDLTRITRVLAYPDEPARLEAAERLLAHATTLEALLGRPVTWDEAAQAFVQAFEERLGIALEPGALSAEETARADQLVAEKYAHPSWTMRV